MKRRQYFIAEFLLAVLLLLQLGSAAATMMTSPTGRNGSWHNYEAMLGHAGTSVALAMHAGHDASPANCDDGGCTVHCATGLIAATVLPVVACAPFITTVPPAAYFPVAPLDRLDRPPKSFSASSS